MTDTTIGIAIYSALLAALVLWINTRKLPPKSAEDEALDRHWSSGDLADLDPLDHHDAGG